MTGQDVSDKVNRLKEPFKAGESYVMLDTLQITSPVATYLNAIIERFVGYKVEPTPLADQEINLDTTGVYNYTI